MEKTKKEIELHCKKCNQRLMDYTLQYNSEAIVIQGITMKCHRCKRVFIMKKYTEGLLTGHACGNILKV